MAPPPIVVDLVEHFQRNEDAYRSGAYNEAQLRREFLDPFFEALGWDVSNRLGAAEAYKDVIHEDAIKVGEGTKAPDYCFRIGGTRKFFVEAKKPSINVKTDGPSAFQLRRYAWSSKLPLSLLTNFAEFAAYDCRVQPLQTDKASAARVLFFTYEQYLEHWDEIASTFSKDAVLKGFFDKFIASTKLKRGTAEVDDAFLREIEKWRSDLASNIALRNPGLSQRELNFAVQRIIDRIIFLRISEDRGIETYGQLRDLQNSGNIYQQLCAVFQRADDRYNSGLFHFLPEKDRAELPDTLTLKLRIDDDRLRGILKRLYYPDSPYEFSVLPVDILGQVYEQFLGKVIVLTPAHRATVKDKPEVKKASGVYYTPTYIVDYIVHNTVGTLLEGRTPKQAARLRILDPACGSGSFLIGAYHYLINWHREWYLRDGIAKHAKEIYQGSGGQWHLTIGEKKRILRNNIYGVDIDTQAVEVTKLSLLLKVLEGESEQTLNTTLRLFHERALPDLGDNIKCGNSLIGDDFYQNQQMSLLDDEERLRVNVFEWNTGFPETMSAGGFDAVIGNPPYGYMIPEEEQSYFQDRYHHQDYQKDNYLLFMERALTLLVRKEGLFGMIIPNPWLTNLLQKNIRRLVTQNACMLEIVHFRFPVFRRVTVDTEIVILKRAVPSDSSSCTVHVVDCVDQLTRPAQSTPCVEIVHKQQKWAELGGSGINIFLSPAETELAAKCHHAGVPLKALCNINVGIKPYQTGKGTPRQTAAIVKNRPFDAPRKVSSQYRAYLRGSDIHRYIIDPIEPRFLKYGPWLAEPRPAANFDAPLKLFIRQTGDSIVAALDRKQYLCLNNMHVLVPIEEAPNLLYILGVINSRLLNWYYHTLNPEVGEALAEVKKTNVEILPVVKPSDLQEGKLTELVDTMLKLSVRLKRAATDHEKVALHRQIEVTDRQIDNFVYRLFDLNEAEISTVEGAGRPVAAAAQTQ